MASPPLYDILSTPYGGRGAFAREAIPQGTMVLACAAPYAHVVYWEFRREVCAWCFAYSFESGKNKWAVKLAGGERAGGNGGVWFCTDACRAEYIREHEVFEGYGAEWRTEINIMVEKMLAGNSKRTTAGPAVPPAGLVYLETNVPSDITPEYLDRAWAAARDVSDQRRGWTEEMTQFEVDTARFVLDGLLRKVIEEMNPGAKMLDRLADSTAGYCVSAGRWADYMELQDNEYALMRSSPHLLASHIRVYRFLRHIIATMPPQTRGKLDDQSVHVIERLLKNLASPTDTRALLGRDSGNVFGLWDTATEGSEMLGWGAFVFGSYFNHRMYFLLFDCSAN